MTVTGTQVAGGPKSNTKRVWYTGSDQLKTGMILCYNQDATDDGTDTGLGHAVEKPATANLDYVAGVVAAESHNVTGPNFVTIITPKPMELFDIYIDSDMTSAVLGDALGAVNAKYGAVEIDLSTFSFATIKTAFAIAAETGTDASVTAATMKAWWWGR